MPPRNGSVATASSAHAAPDDEERGTTYFNPPPRRGQHMQGLLREVSSSSNINSSNSSVVSVDPPARHIKEERSSDEPSSYVVNHHGELEPATQAYKKPPIAMAQIVEDDDEPTQYQIDEEEDEEEEDEPTEDSISGAWRRRGGGQLPGGSQGQAVVAVPVETTWLPQRDPDGAISQPFLLPVGQEYASSFRRPQQSRPTLMGHRSMSGWDQATVLSERTWGSHDQFRSSLAIADPLFVTPDDNFVSAMQQFSLEHKILEGEEGSSSSRSGSMSQSRTSRSRIHGSSIISNTANSSGTFILPPPPAHQRSTSDHLPSPPPPPPLRQGVTSVGGTSVASATTNNSHHTSTSQISTESMERLEKMKKNRVRLQRGLAVGGLVAGTILTGGALGAVAVAAGGYAVTRLAGRHRERKIRQQLEEEEEGELEGDIPKNETDLPHDGHDHTIPLYNIFHVPHQVGVQASALQQKIHHTRFKHEGSRPTDMHSLRVSDSQQTRPADISLDGRRTRRCSN